MNQLTPLSRMAVIPIMIFTSMMALADDAIIVQSGMGERIDHHLSEMEAVGFSGAIVVMHEGEVVLRKGYGLANREQGIPYTPKTLQSHGSITKQITAAAILKLQSQHQLSTDDVLSDYFEGVPKDKANITIHQLLTHSSGLPGAIGPDREPITAADFLKQLWSSPLQFESGSRYDYCNTGYSLLAMIIERVSGLSYEDYIQTQLLKPQGLVSTGYRGIQDRLEDLAVGYRHGKRWGYVHDEGWLWDEQGQLEGPGWHLRGNGGLHTNLDDMAQWLRTLQGDGALDEQAHKQWLTPYIEETGGLSSYGYGWSIRQSPYGVMINHRGSNGVFSSEYVWLPDQGVFFYIQGNSTEVPALEMRPHVLEAAFEKE